MDTDDDKIIAQLGALSQATRLRAFKTLIRAGTKGVAAGQLAANLDVAPNTLSSHLNVLQRSGLIQHRRSGRSVIYFVDIEEVSLMIDALVSDCCAGYPDAANVHVLSNTLSC